LLDNLTGRTRARARHGTHALGVSAIEFFMNRPQLPLFEGDWSLRTMRDCSRKRDRDKRWLSVQQPVWCRFKKVNRERHGDPLSAGFRRKIVEAQKEMMWTGGSATSTPSGDARRRSPW